MTVVLNLFVPTSEVVQEVRRKITNHFRTLPILIRKIEVYIDQVFGRAPPTHYYQKITH